MMRAKDISRGNNGHWEAERIYVIMATLMRPSEFLYMKLIKKEDLKATLRVDESHPETYHRYPYSCNIRDNPPTQSLACTDTQYTALALSIRVP
jgi:hypothetical protein